MMHSNTKRLLFSIVSWVSFSVVVVASCREVKKIMFYPLVPSFVVMSFPHG